MLLRDKQTNKQTKKTLVTHNLLGQGGNYGWVDRWFSVWLVVDSDSRTYFNCIL